MKYEINVAISAVLGRYVLTSKVMQELRAVDGMVRLPEGGRCLYEGVQRGALLKVIKGRDDVARDPGFRKALAALRTMGSVMDWERLANLFLIVKFFLGGLSNQNIIEFGTYRGGSAAFLATLLAEYYPSARMLSLDTFAGIPDTNKGKDGAPLKHFAAENFSKSAVDQMRRKIRALGLKNLDFVQGRIEDTAAGALESLGCVGLSHVDVVLYEPTAYASRISLQYLTPGGYLVQDDGIEPCCPGAMVAAEDLIRKGEAMMEQSFPQIVFRAPEALDRELVSPMAAGTQRAR
jgi:hypothetical protein